MNCISCSAEFLGRKSCKNRTRANKYCSRKCINNQEVHKRSDEKKLSDLKKLFYKKVIINSSGCWGWDGYRTPSGYARISFGREKELQAHRASWMIHNGPIPEGMFVCHTCDVRDCTAPHHLFMGDHDINMLDMKKKKRNFIPIGEKSSRTKLTDDKVREIKIHLKNGISRKEVAEKYNVNEWVIRHIDSGTNWKHIKLENQ